MPATYSINVGLLTESERKKDINSVLAELPDNTQKLISPRDVRDAFLSTWSNAVFKQTIGQGSIEYIGIDTGNPQNRDIKNKIYIGKRNYAGLDIMNSNLLSNTNPTDIYFFNTKPDSATQSETRISILAGTNSALYETAPYIQTKVNSSDLAMDLDIINPSPYNGPINIVSQTGRVSLNGIVFPTIAETAASASNGRILKYYGSYPSGSFRWEEPTVTIESIGDPNLPLNIYGSPSNVNGFSLEFVEDDFVAQKLGGVDIGMSFSAGSFNGQNWPITEVLRKLLYPYVPPQLSLQLRNSVTGNSLIEVGVTNSIVFTYSITLYSEDIDNWSIRGPIPPGSTVNNIATFSGLSFSGKPLTNLTGTFSYDVRRTYGTISPYTNNYVLNASDSGYSSFSHSSTASLTVVSPIFTGFTDYFFDFNAGATILKQQGLRDLIIELNKNIINYPGSTKSLNINYSGQGYLYFIVPWQYTTSGATLSKIKDPNGFVIHDSSYPSSSTFTYSSTAIEPSYSGVGYSGYNRIGSYRVYVTSGTCSYSGLGSFEFIF